MPIVLHEGDDMDISSLSGLFSQLKNVNHETLNGLLGGSASGHYHLTNDELSKLITLITELLAEDGERVSINHETLEGLLGGGDHEHFHITDNELSKLQSLIEFAFSGSDVEISHSSLSNVQPSDVNQYHLTRTQYETLGSWIENGLPSGGEGGGVTNHENLTGLLGGNDEGHYHLTSALLERVISLLPRHIEWLEFLNTIMKLNTEKDKGDGYPVINHNKLDKLQGGETNSSNGEFYHLTKVEWQQLGRMIAFLFEEGSNTRISIPHASLVDVLPANSYQYHLTESQYNTLKDWIDNGLPNSGGGSTLVENWIFTLDDGSTVTKQVQLHNA